MGCCGSSVFVECVNSQISANTLALTLAKPMVYQGSVDSVLEAPLSRVKNLMQI